MKDKIIQQILSHRVFFTSLITPAKKHEIPTWLASTSGAHFERTVVDFFARLSGLLYSEDADQKYMKIMTDLRSNNKDTVSVFFDENPRILQFFIENIENILPAADAFQRINMNELVKHFDKYEKDSDPTKTKSKTFSHSFDSYFSIVTNKIYNKKGSKVIDESSFEDKLSQVTTLKEVHDIFIAEKLNPNTAQTHRLKFLTSYGDSITYKNKINSIVQKARIISPLSFYEFDLLKKMYFEGKRCSVPDNFEITKLKEDALKFFLMQIERSRTISEINTLFFELKDRENILRVERKNFLHPYGDTNSFIRALIALAQKILITSLSDNSDYNILINFASELNNHVPKRDCPDAKEWDLAKTRINQHVEKLKGHCSNINDTFNQAIQQTVICSI